MCGIVGYIGPKASAAVVLSGLQALEYRGYDSAGIAMIEAVKAAPGKPKQQTKQAKATLIKQVGRVEGLVKLVEDSPAVTANLAIGHTRWATHGQPSIPNSHPHANAEETIFVVHNGIIENFTDLREELEKEGYVFKSQTDTEVVPHLLDFYYKQTGNFLEAIKRALTDMRGAYAIAAITTDDPDTLYAARLSSPLVVGVGDKEFILASDPTAIMEYTKRVVYLEDYDIAVLKRGSYEVHNLKEEKPIERVAELLEFDSEQARLGDFPHFMLKEIYEAPQTIRSAILGRVRADQGIVKLGGLECVAQQLKYIDRIVITACGTASYAGMLGEYYFEEIAGIPAEVQIGSEFIYRNEPFSRSTALIAVSQSGETADTISSLKKVGDYGCLRLGVVNAVGSAVARITDAGVYCHAGPEQAVASTKAFIAQVTVLLLIALKINNGSTKLYKPLLKELERLPEKAQKVLDQDDKIRKVALKYKDYTNFLFIGRRYGAPTALEGALKLKECTLIHAEGYAAGEMKHGPLAMIDEEFPTFALACNSPMLEKTISNLQEIKARKGPIVAIATKGNTSVGKVADDVIYIPDTLEQTAPILQAIVMQLFAYHIAVAKGLNVDRPRNLAKSVTVE